ncbi:GDP-mannose transporter [Ilyonectria destructans]|nr:GDP-mannose transporter [Ilyonectria destructans]
MSEKVEKHAVSNANSYFTPRKAPGRGTIPNGISTSLSKLEHSPAASILAYCLSSISMTVVNKYVVSGVGWNLNFLYLAVQSVVCTIAVMACKKIGLLGNLAPFDWDKAKTWFPISLLLVGMIYTCVKTLQFISVPVYTIFKNLAIIVIAYGEVFLFGSTVSPLALVAFALMILSSVVAGWADIQSAISASDSTALSTLNSGYIWMGLNVICSAAYSLGMNKGIKITEFSNWDVIFYNNLLTIPILLASSLLLEDYSAPNMAINFPVGSRNHLLIGMVYSGMAALFICYSTAWCIRNTSSTTYAMTGALNKLPLAISGFVLFSTPVTRGNVSAIGIMFLSGIVYALAKIRHGRSAKESSLPIANQPVMSANSRSEKRM